MGPMQGVFIAGTCMPWVNAKVYLAITFLCSCSNTSHNIVLHVIFMVVSHDNDNNGVLRAWLWVPM